MPRELTQALYLQPRYNPETIDKAGAPPLIENSSLFLALHTLVVAIVVGTDSGSGRKQVCELAGPGRLFGGARSAPSGAVHALEHGRRRWEARRRRGTGLAVFLRWIEDALSCPKFRSWPGKFLGIG